MSRPTAKDLEMLDFGLEFDLTLGVRSSNSKVLKTPTPKLKNKPKVFKNTEKIIAKIAKTVPRAFIIIPCHGLNVTVSDSQPEACLRHAATWEGKPRVGLPLILHFAS
jgi:hypothetical protein